MRRWLLGSAASLLALTVVVACAGLPDSDVDYEVLTPDGSTEDVATRPAKPVDQDGGTSIYKSGARLKVRWVVTGDGYRGFDGWYDADRKEACVRSAAADGMQRCLPRDITTTASVYGDTNCTERLAQVVTDCTAHPNVAVFDPAGPRHIHQLGAAHTSTLYTKGAGDECTPTQVVNASYYAVGPEIPASTFVALDDAAVTSVNRLVERYAESVDGAHQFLGWTDQPLASWCSFDVASDSSTRCLPYSALAGDYFGDDACNTPVVTFDASRTDRPLFAYLPPAICGAGTRVFRVGNSIPSEALRRRDGAACAAANVNRKAWTIAEIPPSELVAPVVVKDATGRIRGTYDALSGDGRRQLRRWTDTMLGDVNCTFSSMADGHVRCLPATATMLGDNYSDAACTKPLRLAYTTKDNCDPPRYASSSTITCASPSKYYRLKPKRYTADVYKKDGSCVKDPGAASRDQYELDKDVAMTDFAEGALLTDP